MRDPRQDPQTGDIVGRFNNRRHVILRDGDFVAYRRGVVPNPNEPPRKCDLATWQAWCQKCEVIKAS